MNDGLLQSTKQTIKMAESKAVLFLLNLIWPPLYVFAWITNLDNVKSTILFIIALVMGLVRFGFWIVRALQNKELKDLDIEERREAVHKKEK